MALLDQLASFNKVATNTAWSLALHVNLIEHVWNARKNCTNT